MIESDDYGGFTMYCDICDNDENFETNGNWQDMIAAAKGLGWKIRKEKDDWKHYCPDCAKELH